MMRHGELAVAVVQRQVMVVKAVRSHTQRDRFLDVCTYTPIGDHLFLATDVPNARVSPSDILTIFPFQYFPCPSSPPTITSNSCETLINYDEDADPSPTSPPSSITFEMLELPPYAFHEFFELCSRNQKSHEKLWAGASAATYGFKIKNMLLRFC